LLGEGFNSYFTYLWRKYCFYDFIIGSKQTEKIYNGIRAKKIPGEIQEIGRRKLRMLNSYQDVNDLKIPPSNRLEKLKGNLSGYYSIRINKQWRIVFRWIENNAYDVQIVDYH
jgi:proteic killer suppression protein